MGGRRGTPVCRSLLLDGEHDDRRHRLPSDSQTVLTSRGTPERRSEEEAEDEDEVVSWQYVKDGPSGKGRTTGAGRGIERRPTKPLDRGRKKRERHRTNN